MLIKNQAPLSSITSEGLRNGIYKGLFKVRNRLVESLNIHWRIRRSTLPQNILLLLEIRSWRLTMLRDIKYLEEGSQDLYKNNKQQWTC
jgi:hypothetical protein